MALGRTSGARQYGVAEAEKRKPQRRGVLNSSRGQSHSPPPQPCLVFRGERGILYRVMMRYT